MKKLFYPAIFHAAEEGGYWITFPDFEWCATQGKDMEEAYAMAWEVLGIGVEDCIKKNIELPVPSNVKDIDLDKDSAIVIIEFDYEEFRKKYCSKAVKKTLTIPQWLNEEATAMGVNFSQVLQEALLQKIRLK